MTLEEDFKKYETSYKQYYGENYDKALKNLRSTKKSLRDNFLKKYPNANIKMFNFNVILSKSGDVTGQVFPLRFATNSFWTLRQTRSKSYIPESCTGHREYGVLLVRFSRS